MLGRLKNDTIEIEKKKNCINYNPLIFSKTFSTHAFLLITKEIYFVWSLLSNNTNSNIMYAWIKCECKIFRSQIQIKHHR